VPGVVTEIRDEKARRHFESLLQILFTVPTSNLSNTEATTDIKINIKHEVMENEEEKEKEKLKLEVKQKEAICFMEKTRA